MAEQAIRVEKVTPGYWRATIDNPPLNFVDPQFYADLDTLVTEAATDDEVRVIVFDTANPEYFIAHFDVAKGAEVQAMTTKTTLPIWPELADRLGKLPAITIASIRGRTRGIGSEFVLALDIRFASKEKAVLGQPEVGLGLVPGGGALERLPWVVGRGRALEILVGSNDYDAESAERYGYVNRAVPDDELDSFVDAFARRVGSFSKQAIIKVKQSVTDSQPLPSPGTLAAAEAGFFESTSWPDTQARLGAAFERGLNAPGEYEDNLGARLGE